MTLELDDRSASAFSAAWLSLREPYDREARSEHLAAAFCHAVAAAAEAPRLLDLAAGSGANAVYLAPRLPEGQRWTLVDRDAGLLAAATTRLPDGMALSAVLDLGQQLAAIDLAEYHGVTASALMDLVSLSWFADFADRCAAAGVPVLLALNFDGQIAWAPEHGEDDAMLDRFNRHQRIDKGFGPALGPAAANHMTRILGRHGYNVAVHKSPWRLGADDGELLGRLIEGLAGAAREIEPGAEAAIVAWQALRRREIEAGTLSMLVSHVDLLALPRGSRPPGMMP